MKMSMILSKKQSAKGVLSIPDNATLREAAKRLCKDRVGSLLVERDGEYVGIITERDIIRMCCYEGEFYNIMVDEVMTEDLVTCDSSANCNEVLNLMNSKGIRHVPITEKGKIIGVISVIDIVRELYLEDEVKIHDLADLSGASSRNKVF